MKKLFIFRTCLLTVLCMIFSSTVWAEDKTEISLGEGDVLVFTDFSIVPTDKYSSSAYALIASDGNTYPFTLTSTMYNGQREDLQLQKTKGKVTTPTIKTKKGFIITVTYQSSKALTLTCGESKATGANPQATVNDVVTLSLDATEAQVTIAAGSNAAYISNITIEGKSSVAAPVITSTADDDNSFISPITVTIKQDDAARIVYTLDGTVPTTTNGNTYAAPFTLSETTTVKAIALNSNNVASNITSVTYSYLPISIGIKGILQAIDEGTKVGKARLTNAVVTYKNGSYTYLQDGTSPDNGAGILLFVSSNNLKPGSVINGDVTFGGGQIFNGLYEITAIDTEVTGATITEGSVPDPVEVAAADLVSDIYKYESYYIKVKGLKPKATVATKTNVSIATGVDNLVLLTRQKDLNVAAADETTFTGFAANYETSNTKAYQLYVFGQENLTQTSEVKFATDYDYATRVEPTAYTLPDGVEASYVSAANSTTATLTAITDVVPANTPVLLKAAAKGATATITFSNYDKAAAPTDNLLHGSDVMDLAADAYTFYILNSNSDGVIGFYWAAANGGKPASYVSPYAYLALPKTADAKAFISLDGTATAIDSMESREADNQPIYNLQGIRVSKPTRGIYVRAGKKFIVR